MKALVLQFRYLTGRSIATAYNDRERAEWPPHPARLYSALVATWFDSEEHHSVERSALEWVASLAPPCIYASEASHRRVVPHFVPVNDVSVLGTFERQREQLAELQQALEGAKTEYERLQRGGDKREIEKAAHSLAKEEKALGAGRKKLEKLVLEDQQPYAIGKHPETGLRGAWALIPEHRLKQPRSFPSVSPNDPRVFVRWSAPADGLERHSPALTALAGRVVRVGHSASLVACSLVDDCPTPRWEPSESGDEVLRVPGPGQFATLEEAFERHQEIEPRILPCRFQRYGRVREAREEPNAKSHFGNDWIVFRQIKGRRLSQPSCVAVARAMRGALMKYADNPPPELLSGHTKSGSPSEQPHLAIVPLPFVGHAHASGELLGVALIFPREADDAQRQSVLRAIGRWEDERRKQQDDYLVDAPLLELTLGRAGVIGLERLEGGVESVKTLRGGTWSRSSHAWVTTTPIALDRNPGDLFSRDREAAKIASEAAERSIITACERIGLPTPSYVQVHPSVPLIGTVKARLYPAFPADPKKNQRVKVHARIEFPVRVTGPILLGAGRYYGLGLCLPQPTEARVEG
jgi:CRISPR-associated protein Csb2